MNHEKLYQLNKFYLSQKQLDHYLFKLTPKIMIKEDMMELLEYIKVLKKENEDLKRELEKEKEEKLDQLHKIACVKSAYKKKYCVVEEKWKDERDI